MSTKTRTIKIDAAKVGVLARAARQKSIARLKRMEGLDLHKPKVMARAWR